MRKGVVIGVTTTVIVLSIMVGIASLPDEVLLEPSPFETPQNSVATQTTSTSISEEGGKVAIQEPVVQEEPEVAQEEPEVAQEEPEVAQEEPEVAQEDGEEEKGKTIKVSVHDGAGTKMR